MQHWLRRVRHDLLKHALWRIRDLKEGGGAPSETDRTAIVRSLLELRDSEGRTLTATALWRQLAEEAPISAVDPHAPAALAAFGQAVERAEAAARALATDPAAFGQAQEALLALEGAFSTLAQLLNGPASR